MTDVSMRVPCSSMARTTSCALPTDTSTWWKAAARRAM